MNLNLLLFAMYILMPVIVCHSSASLDNLQHVSKNYHLQTTNSGGIPVSGTSNLSSASIYWLNVLFSPKLVLFSPKLVTNLLSVSNLVDNNYHASFSHDGCFIQDHEIGNPNEGGC